MRGAIAAAIAGLLLWANGATAETGLPLPALSPSSSPSGPAAAPWADAGVDGYSVIIIASTATLGVVAANFVTGGMLTPLLAAGAMPTAAAGPVGATSAATGANAFAAVLAMEATHGGVDLLILAGGTGGPSALASVGQPVDDALRDGYTTPGVLVGAFGESASRAGSMVVAAGSGVGSTIATWWTEAMSEGG